MVSYLKFNGWYRLQTDKNARVVTTLQCIALIDVARIKNKVFLKFNLFLLGFVLINNGMIKKLTAHTKARRGKSHKCHKIKMLNYWKSLIEKGS